METKDKIAIKLAIKLIGVCTLISCKAIISPNTNGGDDYSLIKVLGYAYANPSSGDTINTIPSYSFNLPKKMVKRVDYDMGITVVEHKDYQYIYIIYEPNKFSDYSELISHLKVYLEESDNSRLNKLSNHINLNKNTKRLNRFYRKDNFEIGILNVLPQNYEDLFSVIENSFNVQYRSHN